MFAIAAAACTADGAPPPDPAPTSVATSPCPSFAEGRAGPDCDLTVEVRGQAYEVACVPVPHPLLDVPLAARWGGAKVRSIAAVAVDHGVAVFAGDEAGACGEWTLAARVDLASELEASLAEELRDAAELPADPGGAFEGE